MQEGEETQEVLPAKDLATGVKHDDVYITPSRIEFIEAFEGVTYRQRVTIKNIGSKTALIKIHQPNSIVKIF